MSKLIFVFLLLGSVAMAQEEGQYQPEMERSPDQYQVPDPQPQVEEPPPPVESAPQEQTPEM